MKRTTDNIDPKVRDRLIEYVMDLNVPSQIIGVDLSEKIPEYVDNDV